jgi:hypothetical protein
VYWVEHWELTTAAWRAASWEYMKAEYLERLKAASKERQTAVRTVDCWAKLMVAQKEP